MDLDKINQNEKSKDIHLKSFDFSPNLTNSLTIKKTIMIETCQTCGKEWLSNQKQKGCSVTDCQHRQI